MMISQQQNHGSSVYRMTPQDMMLLKRIGVKMINGFVSATGKSMTSIGDTPLQQQQQQQQRPLFGMRNLAASSIKDMECVVKLQQETQRGCEEDDYNMRVDEKHNEALMSSSIVLPQTVNGSNIPLSVLILRQQQQQQLDGGISTPVMGVLGGMSAQGGGADKLGLSSAGVGGSTKGMKKKKRKLNEDPTNPQQEISIAGGMSKADPKRELGGAGAGGGRRKKALKGAGVKGNGEERYCICKTEWDEEAAEAMVACDGPCKDWFHPKCVGYSSGIIRRGDNMYLRRSSDGAFVDVTNSPFLCPSCKREREEKIRQNAISKGEDVPESVENVLKPEQALALGLTDAEVEEEEKRQKIRRNEQFQQSLGSLATITGPPLSPYELCQIADMLELYPDILLSNEKEESFFELKNMTKLGKWARSALEQWILQLYRVGSSKIPFSACATCSRKHHPRLGCVSELKIRTRPPHEDEDALTLLSDPRIIPECPSCYPGSGKKQGHAGRHARAAMNDDDELQLNPKSSSFGNLAKWDEVDILHGPYAGLNGLLSTVPNDKSMIEILVDHYSLISTKKEFVNVVAPASKTCTWLPDQSGSSESATKPAESGEALLRRRPPAPIPPFGVRSILASDPIAASYITADSNEDKLTDPAQTLYIAELLVEDSDPSSTIFLGIYDTPIRAGRVRDVAALLQFGEKAKLNYPLLHACSAKTVSSIVNPKKRARIESSLQLSDGERRDLDVLRSITWFHCSSCDAWVSTSDADLILRLKAKETVVCGDLSRPCRSSDAMEISSSSEDTSAKATFIEKVHSWRDRVIDFLDLNLRNVDHFDVYDDGDALLLEAKSILPPTDEVLDLVYSLYSKMQMVRSEVADTIESISSIFQDSDDEEEDEDEEDNAAGNSAESMIPKKRANHKRLPLRDHVKSYFDEDVKSLQGVPSSG